MGRQSNTKQNLDQALSELSDILNDKEASASVVKGSETRATLLAELYKMEVAAKAFESRCISTSEFNFSCCNNRSAIGRPGPAMIPAASSNKPERTKATNSRWFRWESRSFRIRPRNAEALELLRAQVSTVWKWRSTLVW